MTKSTNTTKANNLTKKAKPFLVRLSCLEHRIAYERYCTDNNRNLDSQARHLITQELKKLGYIKQSDNSKEVSQKLQ